MAIKSRGAVGVCLRLLFLRPFRRRFSPEEGLFSSRFGLPRLSSSITILGEGKWGVARTRTSMMDRTAVIKDCFPTSPMDYMVILRAPGILHLLGHIHHRVILQHQEDILHRDTHHKVILPKAIPLRAILQLGTQVTPLQVMDMDLAWGQC